jgi:hypothetical protein
VALDDRLSGQAENGARQPRKNLADQASFSSTPNTRSTVENKPGLVKFLSRKSPPRDAQPFRPQSGWDLDGQDQRGAGPVRQSRELWLTRQGLFLTFIRRISLNNRKHPACRVSRPTVGRPPQTGRLPACPKHTARTPSAGSRVRVAPAPLERSATSAPALKMPAYQKLSQGFPLPAPAAPAWQRPGPRPPVAD